MNVFDSKFHQDLIKFEELKGERFKNSFTILYGIINKKLKKIYLSRD